MKGKKKRKLLARCKDGHREVCYDPKAGMCPVCEAFIDYLDADHGRVAQIEGHEAMVRRLRRRIRGLEQELEWEFFTRVVLGKRQQLDRDSPVPRKKEAAK